MVSRGGSVNPSDFPNEEFELYSIPAHDRGGPETALGSEIGSSKQLVQPDDVLISKIIPHIRRARVVGPFSGKRQIASGEWIAFRGSSFHPDYLRHFLVSDRFHSQFMNTVAGVGGSLVRARPAQVKTIPLPLPSLPEQRRIAAILDQTEAIRAKRRQVLAHLDSLTQSVFHDMFGTQPWTSNLGEMVDVQIGPFGSLLHREDYVPGGVPLINPMHIRNGEIYPDWEFATSEAKAEALGLYRLRLGDVVLGRRGEMGRAGVAGEAHEGMICGTGSLILRPKAVSSMFLHSLVSSPRMKGHFERASLGATMSNLNAGIVKAAPAPSPSTAAQEAFAAHVERIRESVARTRAALAADDELFASLQSRAFRGEL